MSYFTTYLSLTLMVKEFLKLENIWWSYRQNGWLFHAPHSPCAFVLKRCWSRQIKWITCVLRTETVTTHCYVNRHINIINKYQTAIDQFWLTDRLMPSMTDRLLIVYDILLRKLFFAVAVVYSGSWDFSYGRCKQLFVSELNNAYFTEHLF